jgi:uncharacterized membrane protein
MLCQEASRSCKPQWTLNGHRPPYTETMSLSARRLAILASLAAITLLDLALVGIRIIRTGDWVYAFLAWNLFLAWIPLLFAMAVYDGFRRRGPVLRLIPLGIGWLLFFPNAPYIVTDFVHLSRDAAAPLWYDGAMIAACAATGLLLGFVSLALVHVVVQRLTGTAAAWAFAGLALVLGSLGIYVGRFLRFNSWDAVTEPGTLVNLARLRVADPFGNPKLLAVTAGLVGFLAIGYLAFYVLARPSFDLTQPAGAGRPVRR